MARTLNNEVDVLNIASLDNDIKDSFTRAMITEDVNTTSAAARRYLEGEYFIHNDRYLYKALEDIAAGTAITPDVNAEVVTVSEELVRLFAQSPEGIFEILSNIENTSVASKNYVKGSQFIWTDKKLYEATDDIVSGSTFVVGTNIKLADNLTSQIQTLTTQTRNLRYDLTNIFRTGSTNSGLKIYRGSFFYLDGILTKAKLDIAQDAPFTSSNCEPVTTGGLTDLGASKSDRIYYKNFAKYGISNSSGAAKISMEQLSDSTLSCIGAVVMSWDGTNSIIVPYWDTSNSEMYLMVYGSCSGCSAIIRGAFVRNNVAIS